MQTVCQNKESLKVIMKTSKKMDELLMDMDEEVYSILESEMFATPKKIVDNKELQNHLMFMREEMCKIWDECKKIRDYTELSRIYIDEVEKRES